MKQSAQPTEVELAHAKRIWRIGATARVQAGGRVIAHWEDVPVDEQAGLVAIARNILCYWSVVKRGGAARATKGQS